MISTRRDFCNSCKEINIELLFKFINTDHQILPFLGTPMLADSNRKNRLLKLVQFYVYTKYWGRKD